MLDIKNLHASYGSGEVLHGVSLTVGDGEFVTMIGANTAGKSTLLRSISGLVPQRSGEIRFRDQDLIALPSHRVPELGLAHVPEGRHVFEAMTVEENLELGAYSRRDAAAIARSLDKVYTLFPRLAERRGQMAGTLSGGERQMVAVGRGLMLEPSLLILDEPSLGLAPKVVEEMHRTLEEIHAEGMSILLVEQNVALALSVAQRGYVLQSGEIVLSGSSRELEADDRVREAYLGI
ncbi:ABC transporter ATP-binding protein [Fodinicurvata sediminis]|uniref:ABC transporter ATP-binding protein n=1 Tax=Fodinicurvata sediminis TaxID=1121832 RepID=UPI0003B31B65|nr:ABC transporter ATP-binding protein [Fodinicurvata sediminis]